MINIDKLEEREASRIKKLRLAAMQRAKEVAAYLKKDYGVSRVILFGSLVNKSYLHEKSDIDLLVEGLKKSDFLHAGFGASIIAKPFNVDIIMLESADPAIVKTAIEKGINL